MFSIRNVENVYKDAMIHMKEARKMPTSKATCSFVIDQAQELGLKNLIMNERKLENA
jgi:hypothetical protein